MFLSIPSDEQVGRSPCEGKNENQNAYLLHDMNDFFVVSTLFVCCPALAISDLLMVCQELLYNSHYDFQWENYVNIHHWGIK